MHRFSWDLKFDPVSPADLIPAGDEEATGAVPGRTYPNYNVPWVPPGSYTVRLTVDGVTKTQPITVRLDPRVKIAPDALATLNSLSTDLYWEAVAAHRAFNEATRAGQDARRRDRAPSRRVKSDLEVLAPSSLQRNVRAVRRRGECAGHAVARSGQQRVAGRGDVDAISRSRADRRADRRGDAAARRRRSR